MPSLGQASTGPCCEMGLSLAVDSTKFHKIIIHFWAQE